jgi:hypothetical protein
MQCAAGGLPTHIRNAAAHDLIVIGRCSTGQPRTYRLARSNARDAAYRRLAVAVLGLDIRTLARELRAARVGNCG